MPWLPMFSALLASLASAHWLPMRPTVLSCSSIPAIRSECVARGRLHTAAMVFTEAADAEAADITTADMADVAFELAIA